MADLQKLKAEIPADGTIQDHEVEVIRRELYADGRIEREEVEFLIALRNEAQSACPAFEQLFFQAVKEKVLTDGSIAAEESAWLRQILFTDGQIDERERTFLRELDAEAQSVCPEFEQLYDECMKA
jgi:hypothetical protein